MLVESKVDKQFVIYTDLVGRLWLGLAEEVSEDFVCVENYDIVKRNSCYKAHVSLWNKDLLGYSYQELVRNRPNIKFELEPF